MIIEPERSGETISDVCIALLFGTAVTVIVPSFVNLITC